MSLSKTSILRLLLLHNAFFGSLVFATIATALRRTGTALLSPAPQLGRLRAVGGASLHEPLLTRPLGPGCRSGSPRCSLEPP